MHVSYLGNSTSGRWPQSAGYCSTTLISRVSVRRVSVRR